MFTTFLPTQVGEVKIRPDSTSRPWPCVLVKLLYPFSVDKASWPFTAEENVAGPDGCDAGAAGPFAIGNFLR